MKPLMVQGTSSGAGKSTLVAALCRIFEQKGYLVAPFKSQNMSNFGYSTPDFEISRAQAIQAIAAKCPIEPDLNPIMLKPLGNYYSAVYLNGKYYKKMHAKDYYSKFVKSKGLKAATTSLSKLKKNYDLVILEGAGSPAEINLQKYDIANMQIAQKANTVVSIFGNPYSLKYFEKVDQLICAYEADPLMQRVVPQVIFGAITCQGRLPVTATDLIKEGMGESLGSIGRLGFAYPEYAGVSSAILKQVDSLGQAVF